ncbi:hypothetical protein EVA_05549 [gut metagenome]|uniref:Uncharacterized protein n=1 Tax=gut metagenome TaxID=749906 RepID=J9GZH3_9ZZZZ
MTGNLLHIEQNPHHRSRNARDFLKIPVKDLPSAA